MSNPSSRISCRTTKVALRDEVHLDLLGGARALGGREREDVGEERAQSLESLPDVRVVLDVVGGRELAEPVQTREIAVGDRQEVLDEPLAAFQPLGFRCGRLTASDSRHHEPAGGS